MANRCYNQVEFTGKSLTSLINSITSAKEVTKKGEGWLPRSTSQDYRAIFDIYVYAMEDDLIIFECTSKWAPPIEALEILARQANANFTCRYVELGGGLFGQYNYNSATQTLTDTCLSSKELATVTIDEDSLDYFYKGEMVESQDEIYEGLLDDKLNALGLN
jgi:hypothetical protein